MLNELQHNWSARHWRIPRRSRWVGGFHAGAAHLGHRQPGTILTPAKFVRR